MNKKTYLVVGGTSVVSLAIGAAGGYFLAKKQFEDTLNDKIAAEVRREVSAVEKHFSILLMQARDKPENPEDISLEDEGVSVEEEPEVLTPEEEKVVQRAQTALTDYRGFSDNPGTTNGVVASNIFDTDSKKARKLPPRDPHTGHFLPKGSVEPEETPYMITAEDFLRNEPGHTQENVKYFIDDKTIIDNQQEEVEIDLVGEVSLTLFPDVPDGEPSIICVRNEAKHIDYEILLVHGSLTEYMGLGETDEDLPHDEYDDLD